MCLSLQSSHTFPSVFFVSNHLSIVCVGGAFYRGKNVLHTNDAQNTVREFKGVFLTRFLTCDFPCHAIQFCVIFKACTVLILKVSRVSRANTFIQWNGRWMCGCTLSIFTKCYSPIVRSLVTSFHLTFKKKNFLFFSDEASWESYVVYRIHIFFFTFCLSAEKRRFRVLCLMSHSIKAAKAASSTFCKVNKRKAHSHTYGHLVWHIHMHTTHQCVEQS